MLGSILSFSPETSSVVSRYCEEHSNSLPTNLQELWRWTSKSFKDADKMSSQLQGAWMIFLAEDRRAERILEIGSYSGYSALAWYEGTKMTQAEIITLELNPEMIATSRNTFNKYNVNDRVRLIEGLAGDSLKYLSGTFDIIFVDANKDGYEEYVKTILDNKLLSPNGIILCDNVFARGLTIGKDTNPHLDDAVRPYWTECGKALDHFNKYVASDPRVDVTMLPLFDGVSQIKWKLGFLKQQVNGTNGTNGTNGIHAYT